MPTQLEFIGADERWFETAVTGKSRVWSAGRIAEVADSEAAALLGTGKFRRFWAIQMVDDGTPDVLSTAQVAALGALVGGSRAEVQQRSELPSSARSAFWSMTDGGSTLAAANAKGPSFSVGGVVTGSASNPGWFTHDAAQNTIKLGNDPYINGLLDMSVDCSIIIGLDFWVTTWPSSTETIWAIHRPDLSTGGVRLPILSASPGRFGVYYRSNGGAESELIGYTMPGGTFLGRRISLLTELRVLPSKGELHPYLYVNGYVQRGRMASLATPPAADANGGLSFSGHGGAPPGNKLNSGGSGARSAWAFVVRASADDKTTAPRLAAAMANLQAIPSWLNQI